MRGLLVALAVLSLATSGGWFLLTRSFSAEPVKLMTHKVTKSEFLHDITDRGSVESSSNVEIRCEVKSDRSSGSTLLKIIAEGTRVEEGDELAVLDSFPLEKEMFSQEIVCNRSEADVIQAQNTYDTAVIAKKEYLGDLAAGVGQVAEGGKYNQEVETIESEIFVAMENLSRAEEYLEHSKRLFAKGYVTEAQLKADGFAVEKAKKDMAAAETKMDVLVKYTKIKMENTLEANIRTAKAKLNATKASHKLDVEQLELLEKQIGNCVIKAPQAGQVVYANQSGGHGRKEVVIEEGILVREGQVIIRLPDPSKMQVKVKVNEAKVTLVEEGMSATIRLDAFPDIELKGTVEKVNDYPEPTSWYGSASREYVSIVRINETHTDLLPGMTAEVKIHVQTISDVINVPVQALFQHNGKFYCVFQNSKKLKHREVKIGPTNDKYVVIREGLQVGQEIVLNAAAVRDRLNLPPEKKKPGNGNGRRKSGSSGRSRPQSQPGEDRQQRPGSPAASVGQMFSRLDRNGNGLLEADEIPEQMKSRMADIDANGDGVIDCGELTAAMARMGQDASPAGRPSRAGPSGARP